MKKSMKKRSLMSAVAMLVISAIVLTTSTYAWFSIGDSAQVQSFSVEVEAQSGITFSLDGTNYYSTITTSELRAALGVTNFSDIDFVPVDYNGTSVRLGTPQLDNTLLLTAATPNQHYLEFDLFVKVAEDGVVAFKNGVNDSSFGGNNTSDIAYLAFEEYTIEEPRQKINTTIYSADGNGGYGCIKEAITTPTPTQPANIVTGTDVEPMTITTGTIDNFTIDFDGTGNNETVRLFKIRAWIEGQDPQCTGSYSGGTISLSLFAYFAADEPVT